MKPLTENDRYAFAWRFALYDAEIRGATTKLAALARAMQIPEEHRARIAALLRGNKYAQLVRRGPVPRATRNGVADAISAIKRVKRKRGVSASLSLIAAWEVWFRYHVLTTVPRYFLLADARRRGRQGVHGGFNGDKACEVIAAEHPIRKSTVRTIANVGSASSQDGPYARLFDLP